LQSALGITTGYTVYINSHNNVELVHNVTGAHKMYYTSVARECKEEKKTKLTIMSIKKAEGKETAELMTM